jgi:hypothetical protein
VSNRVKAAIRDAKSPERSVTICLEADLVAEYEAAFRELEQVAQQPSKTLAGDPRKAELAKQLEALREQMLQGTAVFRFRALERRAFRRLIAEHPPRKDEASGEVHEKDKNVGVNAETFYDELIRRSSVDVRLPGDEAGTVLDEEDWRILLGDNDVERARRERAGEPVEDGKLTDMQFSELAEAAWMLNRGEIDIPFSLAAWQLNQSSGTE